jgi:hypothetical protein
VNREERQVFQGGGRAPIRWQDKYAPSRVSAASGHALKEEKSARNTGETTIQGVPQHQAIVHKHSTKRRTTLAAGWIDHDTDAYIKHREIESKKIDRKYTRSKVVAEMLKERAQDDIIKRNTAIIVSAFRGVLHTEFWAFANRFLAINARIAFWVGQSFYLQVQLLSLLLRNNMPLLRSSLAEAKSDAKKAIRSHDFEVDEVKDILLTEMKEGRG